MIITDKFVLLAAPKTGTSFTTAVLRTIHARRRLIGRLLPHNLQQRVFRHFQLERPGTVSTGYQGLKRWLQTSSD